MEDSNWKLDIVVGEFGIDIGVQIERIKYIPRSGESDMGRENWPAKLERLANFEALAEEEKGIMAKSP